MKTLWNNYRYLLLRRTTQIGIMLLYFGANAWGWDILMGNLSSSLLFGVVPLSDPYAALQMFAAGSIMAVDLLIGATIIIFFYAIVGGRVFCSWVCPINPITDLANYLRRVLGFNQIQKKQPASRNIRYWTIVLSLIISFGLGVTAFEFISPISMVHRGIIFSFGFGIAAILVIFLFDLFVLKNGWCGHICPLGGAYSIIGKYSLLRVHHDSNNCTACMKCKEVCPEVQVLHMIAKNTEPVLSGECTNCARCIEVCDDDALEFSIRNFKNGS
jgi:ferredoxin-type protein NapH